MTEIEELKARIAKLEAAAEPPKPFVSTPHRRFDPFDQISIPQEIIADMARVVPDRMVAEIVGDGRRRRG
jgi:hypothetical protein